MYTYNLGLKFRQVAAQNPDRKAVIFPDEDLALSFRELEELSNRLANWLVGRNLKPGQVAAIQNDKTPFGFAAMLACLKLGLVYTNFDAANPKERLSKIFQTARPALILSDKKMAPAVVELAREMGLPCADYSEEEIQAELAGQESRLPEELPAAVTGDRPAYLMFTSGSTGVPKGVTIKHESVLNFISWSREAYALRDDDILTGVNPIYFDNSVFDFYCSLFNGLALAAFPLAVVSRPKRLLELIDRAGCTVWFSVPSFLIYLTNLKLLTPETFAGLRVFAFGGEAYPKELLKKLYGLYGRRARFYNVYGPTEGTCICSAHQLRAEDFEEDEPLVTLGRLARNFDYRIFDEHDRESSRGELCLLGPQLALGYYNDPERTDRSFQPDPVNPAFRRIMYRTGDLVEEKSGRLYFRGRADNQIKHMGYRIELEEIEAALIKLPGVRQCAAVHGRSSAGFSRLAAFVASEHVREQKQLRQELRAYLPDYMIPNIFEYLDDLPKNPNGKVDRLKLKELAGLI